jgi:hypothetical protein
MGSLLWVRLFTFVIFTSLLSTICCVQVSKLQFVDLPGSELLGMDPEVLQLREGAQLNKSLLQLAITWRRLAQEGSAEFVDYDEAQLIKLLSGALAVCLLACLLSLHADSCLGGMYA